MCGIFGCILKKGNAAPIIHAALKRLEYRGYDSVGEATIKDGKLFVKKDAGKIDDVHAMRNLDDLPGRIGVGHTRWATHGAPSQVNAHPHFDCSDPPRIVVIHNGIIENFAELKKELEDSGHVFRSKTDTEVIAHLIEENLKKKASASGIIASSDFENAVMETVKRLQGSYAFAVISTHEPNKIICARNESPIVLGIADDAYYFASDVPAFLPLTNKVVFVENGELVILSDEGFGIKKLIDGSTVIREPKLVDWTAEMAEKQGYPHFMLKEIHEQPRCLRNTLRLQDKYLELLTTFLDRAREVVMVACGTSYHACLAASYMFSKMSFLATHPVIASEFTEQHGKSVNIDSTILSVSQSGETADTLAAVESARQRAATILGLTNVVGSTLTRVSRVYIGQQSGPEIGVAATKTFTSQLSVLSQLAIRLAKKRGKVSQEEIDLLDEKIENIPDAVEKIVETQEEKVKALARKYKDKQCFFFLGRGISYATALEGRLKLMEIAYVPSIAFPAGESKHGPISLIEQGFPVIFVCPPDDTQKTLIGNIMEMKARGASIIAICEEGDEEIIKLVDDYIEITRGIPEILSPIPYAVPLQLFAYYMAIERGCDPDMPRNLAKSVTVK
ncbi:MAG: glutamine--fructose-6-phosphate transaminase (isomerizing) [Candidatus Bathyarchaeota archaeon]|nr:glutamine--fructose-6-phosphate transaminase (isomerizing) [Candidatus Bathyarchaeota archaeon]MDH5494904.1 glutamine--fructose-6-phosphate transaminase (isomerizing) [Candidatus Bathyarchaeota archaeon]